ncbi:hypothetical protein V5O48_013839 [Marasmius crinis-equi]|uniref:Uncharacterized protein n=1 Tax=Marasmius crinis-equi TaxID=585013 RepID=A0ABR3EYZ5_9AGAR
MPAKTRATAKKNANSAASKPATAPKAQTSKGKGATTSKTKEKGASSTLKRKHSAESIDKDEIQETSGTATAKGTKGNGTPGARSSAKDSEQPAQKKKRTADGTAKSSEPSLKAKEGSGGATTSEAAKGKAVQNAKAKGSAENKNKDAKSVEPEQSSSAPSLSFTGGAFDIYAMPLPFLQKVLKPTSDSKEDYSALYNRILELQAKPDNSGQLALHVPASANGYGRLSSGMLTEPFGDEPYDIGLASIERHTELKFTAKEKGLFWPSDAVPKGEGIAATVVLAEEMCGISGVSGELKISTTPVWKDDKGGLIYQGVMTFGVRYGSMYQRKGHGSGGNGAFGFWLVPSKETRKLECSGVAHLANKKGSKSTGSFDTFGGGYDDGDDFGHGCGGYGGYGGYGDYDSDSDEDDYY